MKSESYAEAVKEIDAAIIDAVFAAMKRDVENTFFSGRVRADRFQDINVTRHNQNFVEVTGSYRLSKTDAETLGDSVQNWSIKIHHQPHMEYDMHGYLEVHFVSDFDIIYKGEKTRGRHVLLTSSILPGCAKTDLTRILTGEFGHLAITPVEDDSGQYMRPLEKYERLFQK